MGQTVSFAPGESSSGHEINTVVFPVARDSMRSDDETCGDEGRGQQRAQNQAIDAIQAAGDGTVEPFEYHGFTMYRSREPVPDECIL
jgi:hypothetical protein